MIQRAPSWLREMLQIWMQWGGIAAASVLGGILLGLLLKNGVSGKVALGIALTFAFALSIWFWLVIGRRLHATQEIYSGFSSTDLQIEQITITNQRLAVGFALVMYCISFHPSKKPMSLASDGFSATSTKFPDKLVENIRV